MADGTPDGSRKQLVYRSANVTVYYEPDRRSIARCAVGPELTEAVTDLVDAKAKPYAIGISPRKSGRYAKSFTTSIVYLALGYPFLMTRVAAELANTDPGASGIEWGQKYKRFGGTRTQAGHHVLRRTLIMLDGTRGGAEAAIEAAHRAGTSDGDTPAARRPSVTSGLDREQFRNVLSQLRDRGFG